MSSTPILGALQAKPIFFHFIFLYFSPSLLPSLRRQEASTLPITFRTRGLVFSLFLISPFCALFLLFFYFNINFTQHQSNVPLFLCI